MKKLFFISIFILLVACVFGQKSATLPNEEYSIKADDTTSISNINTLEDYEGIELPPLSVFLQSVYEHPSVKIYEARRDEEEAILKDTKTKWLNYIRVIGNYQYGQVTGLTKSTTDEIMYTMNSKAQNQYNTGVGLSIPIGDLAGQKQRVRAQKARIRQLGYEQEINIEERKLRILQAYNQVVEQLTTLKAKSDAAALYNAQMKLTEQDFINGTIDISTLSIERSRRTRAVVEYQEGRASLHNSITLLEMLTNVSIMNK